MMQFPMPGGCLCGDVRYELLEDPVTLYACHCTDCQTQSGASFALSMVVRAEGVRLLRGEPAAYDVTLEDGRRKRGRLCARCGTRLLAISSASGLTVLEPGTLDDTSWLRPVGHIWTRSAQPWLQLPEGVLRFEEGPDDEGKLAMVRAWKARRTRKAWRTRKVRGGEAAG